MPIDLKNYHPNWKQISKGVRDAAKNKCEICDAENGNPHPVTGSKVVLTVHHCDHNPKNNQWWNLYALCQRCHIRLDKKWKIFKRNGGE